MVSIMAPVDYFPRPVTLPADDLSWPPAADLSWPRAADFPPSTALPADDLSWTPARDSDPGWGSPVGVWDWDCSPPRSCTFDSEEIQPTRDSLSSLPPSPSPPPPVDSEEKHQAHNPIGLGLVLSHPKEIQQLQLRLNLKLPTIGDFTPLAKRTRVIQDLMHYSLDNPIEPIPRHALISFVNAIAKRCQYLVVKEYLTKESTIIKPDSSADVILDTLIKAQILDRNFNKFNREAIWEAVNDCISEVRSRYRVRKLHQYREYLQSFGFIKWNSSLSEDLKELVKQEPFLGLNSHDKKHEFKIYKEALFLSAVDRRLLGTSACEASKYYPRELPSENEKPRPPLDLIDNLVYKTVELGYVMDSNPEAELAKIKYSKPFTYNVDFILVSRTKREYQKYKLQNGIVRVENISFDVSKKTIWRFFSQCGYVVDVELTSGDKFQTAFVTFSNLESMETALKLKDPVIVNQSVRIISITEYRLKFLKAFNDVESDVVKDDDDMLKLLAKYWYYSKSFCSKN